jgi:hypothetical protein
LQKERTAKKSTTMTDFDLAAVVATLEKIDGSIINRNPIKYRASHAKMKELSKGACTLLLSEICPPGGFEQTALGGRQIPFSMLSKRCLVMRNKKTKKIKSPPLSKLSPPLPPVPQAPPPLPNLSSRPPLPPPPEAPLHHFPPVKSVSLLLPAAPTSPLSASAPAVNPINQDPSLPELLSQTITELESVKQKLLKIKQHSF